MKGRNPFSFCHLTFRPNTLAGLFVLNLYISNIICLLDFVLQYAMCQVKSVEEQGKDKIRPSSRTITRKRRRRNEKDQKEGQNKNWEH